MADTLAGLLRAAIDDEPSRPLVTYYDRATGERTELSGTTFGNWVAKTANWLRDDLDVHADSTVAVVLPMHWHALVIAAASWMLGACVTESPSSSSDLLVIPAARLMELADADAGEIAVTSLDPMGRPVEPRPDHVIDYTTAVRVHGDSFGEPAATWADVAYEGGSLQLTQEQAASAALELAGRFGIRPGQRVLVTAGAPAEAGMLSWAFPVLVSGASLVIANAGDDAEGRQWLERIATQERIDLHLGSGSA